MNTAGTMDCKLVQSLKDYPFHQAYLPQEVCINDQCHDCIKNWVGYFIGQDNIIRKYDSTKTIGRKTPTNGTTSRMSANGSRQATTFHCMDLDLQSCACNDVPCTGTDEYCNLMEYSTSSCKCEIVLEDMHVMVMETNPEHNLKIHGLPMVYIIPRIFIPYGKSHIRPQIPSSQVSTTTSTSDGKSSRKKEDEEEMDKTRQQPTTKGDKTRKQPGTEIRRLQVIDKTKDDGKILTFFKRNIKVGFKQLLFTFSHIGTLVIRKNPILLNYVNRTYILLPV
ncbi:hypothetical protein GQR58_004857 [Nymphon striatum]|nr:hypothetical protein GQR58_004857 [Nymphon striatum]